MLDMHTRPSELMGIDDAYTAFCFDETCAYIIKRLQDGDKIKDNAGEEVSIKKHYTRPSELYSKYE